MVVGAWLTSPRGLVNHAPTTMATFSHLNSHTRGGTVLSNHPAFSDASLSGADIMRRFLPTSPYVGHLGMRLADIQPGQATLTLPFTDEIVTIGTTVHGGAIASLIDTTAMVAAWSDAPIPEKIRGTTVNL